MKPDDTDPEGKRIATGADLEVLAHGIIAEDVADKDLLRAARELFAEVIRLQETQFFLVRRLDTVSDRLRQLIAEPKTRRGD